MAGTEISTEKTETKKPADSNWFVDNVAHPFANAAGLEPWNAFASVVNVVHHDTLPELSLYSVPEASGLSWLTQSVSGGVGGLLPFVVAGKLTGSSMRGTGRFLESASLIEGSGMAAKALASERLAMITGAGLYGAAQKPLDGQTRLGNAAAAAVGMGAFELGGKLTEGTPIISLAGFRNRAIVGFAGASVGSMTGNGIASWQNTGRVDVGSFASIAKAGVSGATLNMLLPVAQRGVEVAKLNLGMSIPVKSYVDQAGWGKSNINHEQAHGSSSLELAKPVDFDPLVGRIAPAVDSAQVYAELAKVLEQTPLTNVKRTSDTSASIDQTRNVVRLPEDAKAPDLGHELAHRIRLFQDEAKFRDAASHLDSSNPALFNEELARQKYIDIRVAQEQAAREAENRVAGNNDRVTGKQAILDDKALDGVTYGQKFAQEADQFVKDGKFRPREDNYGRNKETGLDEVIYNPPVQKQYGLTSKYEVTPGPIKALERYTIVDINGEYLKTVEINKEPQKTDFGTTKLVEKLQNGGLKLQIIKGGERIPDNSEVELYPGGIDHPKFGNVQMIVKDPATGKTSYRKTDNFEAFEYTTPQELWPGVEFDAEDNQAGRTVYHLTDGGKAEFYPAHMQTDFVKPNGSKESLQVETIIRQGANTTYKLADNNWVVVVNDGQNLNATKYDTNFNVTGKFPISHTSEVNPDGTTVIIGDTALSNVQTIEHRVDSTIYRTTDASTQVYDESHVLPTEFGDVRRVDFLPNGFKNYFKEDGTEILTNPNGIKSPYGRVESKESLHDHTVRYKRDNGNTISEYPTAINGVFSGLFDGNSVNVKSVETAPHGLVVTATGGSWTTAEFNFTDSTVDLYNGKALSRSIDLPAKFKFIRQFQEDVYPDGVISPVGPVRMIMTDGTGANTYTLTDGTVSK